MIQQTFKAIVVLFFVLVSFSALMTLGKESKPYTTGKLHVAFPLIILVFLWLGGFFA